MIDDRNAASRAFDAFNLSLICLFAFLCVYPFYYMLCYSLSDPKMAVRGVMLFPRGITLDNFREVMRLSEIPMSALVSVARTLLGTATTLICSGFFAYLVTQRRMYLRKFLYRMVIVTMYVNGGLIPTYLVMRYLGLRNHFLVYILPSAMSAYYIVLIKTF
ncbi:MAG TPA: carbohydrate ABC transporter permease, partial [Clostridia bacterium]|nr:carbohydrate ABC transporter permease [Clostridia bacterium]